VANWQRSIRALAAETLPRSVGTVVSPIYQVFACSS